MSNRYYTWAIHLAYLSLLTSCGARSAEQIGGETNFLSCTTDNDCPAEVSKCVINVCQAYDSDLSEASSEDPGGSPPPDQPSGTQSGETVVDSGIATNQLELIDDAEVQVGASGFFWKFAVGNWFTTMGTANGDATAVNLDPVREASTRAYWVGGTSGQAVLWAQLLHPSGDTADLSAYTGITFWARVGTPNTAVRFAVNAAGQVEQVHNSEVPSKALQVTEEWQRFEVSFAELSSLTDVATIDFVVDGDDENFEAWVDDLALMCDGACP